jgi:hypothetical protein
MRDGDIRLVGWTAQDPPGLEIHPAASQTDVRVLVVAHLRRGALPPARPDANLLTDVLRSASAPYADEAPNP